jgi:hypothetical protein
MYNGFACHGAASGQRLPTSHRNHVSLLGEFRCSRTMLWPFPNKIEGGP